MMGTTVKRKLRKDRVTTQMRNTLLKVYSKKPVIKNVDIEEIKKSFTEN